MVCVIQVCRLLTSRMRMDLVETSSILILLASCLQNCRTYTIDVCTVKNSWWWTGELSETCRVSFQNKFEKLVHLVGFIIRICHDARSPERKISFGTYSLLNSLFTVVSKQITVLYIRLTGIIMSINEDFAFILSSFYAYCSLDNVVSSNSELSMKQSVLWSFGKSSWKANVRTSDLNCCDISTACILVKKKK